MELQDAKTGEKISLEKAEALDAIAKGTHTVPGYRPLLNPQGKLVLAPEEDVKANLMDYGYNMPRQEDLDEAAKQAKFGEGTINEAKAFGAGALRGATFGLSDYGLDLSGLSDAESLAERQKRNPGASIAGEVAGAVGTAFIPGSPVARVGKLGAAITEGLAPVALAEGASLASRAVNAAGQIGARSLGNLVEGTWFGFGKTISEAALGDPDLTADKIAANIGYGALLGGALGGAIKAGELAIPPSVGKAKEVFGRLYDKMTGRIVTEAPEAAAFAGPATEAAEAVAPAAAEKTVETVSSPLSKIAAKVSGEPEQKVLDALSRARKGELLSPEEVQVAQKQFGDSMTEIYDATQKASRDAHALARPAEIETLLANAEVGPARETYNNVLKQINDLAAEMENRPAFYPERFPARLRLIQEDAEAAIGPEAKASDFYKSISEIKKNLDNHIPWGKDPTGVNNDAVNLLKQFRGNVRATLEDEAIWGEAGARQAAYNEAVSEHLFAKKILQKQLMRKIPTKSGGVDYEIDPSKVKQMFNMFKEERGRPRREAFENFVESSKKLVDQIDKSYKAAPFESFDREAMEALLNRNENLVAQASASIAAQPGGFGFFTDLLHPLSAVKRGMSLLENPDALAARLANLERAAQKTSNAVGRTVKALFVPVKETAKKGYGLLREEMTQPEKTQRFNKRVEEIREKTKDQIAFADRLEQATRDSYEVAPRVSQALQMAMLRGTKFLETKIPQQKQQGPFDKPKPPSVVQMTTFDRYYDAVHKPLVVLDELKSNNLLPETMETLQNVYPSLLADMRQEVITEMAAKHKTLQEIPFQRQITLSKFLGQPLSKALDPQLIMANQGVLQAQQAQEQAKEQAQMGMGKTTQKGLQSLDLADATRTSQQRVNQRDRA